jgi:hypothetical protein
MTDGEYQRLKASDRRAYRIEDLPDDLAAELEAGLGDLKRGVAEDGDTHDRLNGGRSHKSAGSSRD